MLRLDLARLERERRAHLQGEIPPDDPLWEGSGLAFQDPLSYDLRAQLAGSGEVVVRGRVEGVLQSECRRCLEPVRTPVAQDLTLVWVPEELLSEETADVRPIPERAQAVEVGAAVREELILAVDPFVLCGPECKGLCPHCGVNLNQQTCDCATDEPDPRWDVLRRTLRNE